MENNSRCFPNLVIVYKSGTSIVGKLTVFPTIFSFKNRHAGGIGKILFAPPHSLHGGEKLF